MSDSAVNEGVVDHAPLPEIKRIKLSMLRFDPTLYVRGKHDPALVQRYATILDQIEAAGKYIAVDSNLRIADGRHRYLAYQTEYKDDPDHEIPVYVYPVADDGDFYELAARLNSQDGWQLTEEHKRQAAIHLYQKYRRTQEQIARSLSVGHNRVNEYLRAILDQERKQRDATIWSLWLACRTQEQIAEAVGLTPQRVGQLIQKMKEDSPQEDSFIFRNFVPELYQVWGFGKLTNRVKVFGSVPQEIVDNLLYYYTKPFDVVFDPFAGGGATIDVCVQRCRRYYASDLSPIPARTDIRQWDITQGLPLDLPVPDLLFLDPPYWQQAAKKYSALPTDLGNMALADFLSTIGEIGRAVKRKWNGSRPEGRLALLIGFCKEDHKYIDLPFLCYEVLKQRGLTPLWRLQVPYSTEVHAPAYVTKAKENKSMLYLTRDLMVFGP